MENTILLDKKSLAVIIDGLFEFKNRLETTLNLSKGKLLTLNDKKIRDVKLALNYIVGRINFFNMLSSQQDISQGVRITTRLARDTIPKGLMMTDIIEEGEYTKVS